MWFSSFSFLTSYSFLSPSAAVLSLSSSFSSVSLFRSLHFCPFLFFPFLTKFSLTFSFLLSFPLLSSPASLLSPLSSNTFPSFPSFPFSPLLLPTSRYPFLFSSYILTFPFLLSSTPSFSLFSSVPASLLSFLLVNLRHPPPCRLPSLPCIGYDRGGSTTGRSLHDILNGPSRQRAAGSPFEAQLPPLFPDQRGDIYFLGEGGAAFSFSLLLSGSLSVCVSLPVRLSPSVEFICLSKEKKDRRERENERKGKTREDAGGRRKER